MNSVLTSIKKLLGIPEEYDAFDMDVIMHINSVLMILGQMGVIAKGKKITDASDSWSSIVDDISQIESIKSYVYMKVRLLFDPPTNSGAVTAMENLVKELEYRLYVERDEIGKP